MPTIYKVLTAQQWLRARAGEPVQSPVDLRDGYVHFSTVDTLQATLDKWFRGEEGCVLLAFDAAAFGNDLRWEPARGGELFPHVYTTIAASGALQVWHLQVDDHGVPRAPERLDA